MSGAAEDGGVKVFIVARVIFHRPPRFPWATREGRARQGRGAGRCGGRCGGRALGRGTGIGLRGPGAARLPRLATRHHRCRRRLCAAHAEIGARLGSSAEFGSGCGQALPGVPRKAPLCVARYMRIYFQSNLPLKLAGVVSLWGRLCLRCRARGPCEPCELPPPPLRLSRPSRPRWCTWCMSSSLPRYWMRGAAFGLAISTRCAP